MKHKLIILTTIVLVIILGCKKRINHNSLKSMALDADIWGVEVEHGYYYLDDKQLVEVSKTEDFFEQHEQSDTNGNNDYSNGSEDHHDNKSDLAETTPGSTDDKFYLTKPYQYQPKKKKPRSDQVYKPYQEHSLPEDLYNDTSGENNWQNDNANPNVNPNDNANVNHNAPPMEEPPISLTREKRQALLAQIAQNLATYREDKKDKKGRRIYNQITYQLQSQVDVGLSALGLEDSHEAKKDFFAITVAANQPPFELSPGKFYTRIDYQVAIYIEVKKGEKYTPAATALVLPLGLDKAFVKAIKESYPTCFPAAKIPDEMNYSNVSPSDKTENGSARAAWDYADSLFNYYGDFETIHQCPQAIEERAQPLIGQFPLKAAQYSSSNPAATPEYNKVWEDGEFHAVFLFGKADSDKVNYQTRQTIDYGYFSYKHFNALLENNFRSNLVQYTALGDNSYSVQLQVALPRGLSTVFVHVIYIDYWDEVRNNKGHLKTIIGPQADKVDFLAYNGHSNDYYKNYVIKFTDPPADQFVLFLINGCHSYSFAHMKDPEEARFDFLVNRDTAYFDTFSSSSLQLFTGLLRQESYSQLLRYMPKKHRPIVVGEDVLSH